MKVYFVYTMDYSGRWQFHEPFTFDKSRAEANMVAMQKAACESCKDDDYWCYSVKEVEVEKTIHNHCPICGDKMSYDKEHHCIGLTGGD